MINMSKKELEVISDKLFNIRMKIIQFEDEINDLELYIDNMIYNNKEVRHVKQKTT